MQASYISTSYGNDRLRAAFNAYLNGTPSHVAFATLPAQDHVDPVLTEKAQNFLPQNFIGSRIFPVLRGLPISATYERWLKGGWFRNEAGPRGDNAAARRVNLRSETVQYACMEQAAAVEIGDRQLRLLGPQNADTYGTNTATEALFLRRERQVATAVLTAANWTSNEDVAGLWAAGAGNTFIVDVENAIETIRARSGIRPNVLMMDASTFSNVVQESTVIARMQLAPSTTSPVVVSAQLLAQLFRLEEVLVGDAIRNSATERADGSDFTAADIWEVTATKGSAFLFYRASSPSIVSPSAGYSITSLGPVVDSFFLRNTKSTVYEAYEEVDHLVTAPDLGHLFVDTIVT